MIYTAKFEEDTEIQSRVSNRAHLYRRQRGEYHNQHGDNCEAGSFRRSLISCLTDLSFARLN